MESANELVSPRSAFSRSVATTGKGHEVIMTHTFRERFQDQLKSKGMHKKCLSAEKLCKMYVEGARGLGVKPDRDVLKGCVDGIFNVLLNRMDIRELSLISQVLRVHGHCKTLNFRVTSGMHWEAKRQLYKTGATEPAVYTKEGVKELVRSVAVALQRHSGVISLSLAGIPLNETMVKFLVKGLRNCNKLYKLDVSRTGMGDVAFTTLVNGLRSLPHLTVLSASHCKLTDRCSSEVLALLKAHGAERDTKLWENTLRGAPTSVCRTQVEVEGLTMLDLSQNNFGRGFGKEISAYIPRDNWLLGLNLRCNRIEASYLCDMADGLQRNSSMVCLDVRDNPGDLGTGDTTMNTIFRECLSRPLPHLGYLHEELRNWGWPGEILLRFLPEPSLELPKQGRADDAAFPRSSITL